MRSLPSDRPTSNRGSRSFTRISGDLAERRDLSDSGLRVLIALKSLAYADGRCYATNRQVGDQAGNKGTRAVVRALKELESLGLVRTHFASDPMPENGHAGRWIEFPADATPDDGGRS